MQIKKTTLEKKIIEIGTEEFLKKGYIKTSVRTIAKRCEISPGNLYNYFNSKEDLYINITMNFNEERVAFIFPRMEKGKTPSEKLEIYAQAHLEYAKAHREKFRLFMYYELNGLNEKNFSQKTMGKFKKMKTGNWETFLSIIREGINKGELNGRFPLREFIKAYTMSVRIALNEVILLNYEDEEFFHTYVKFLASGYLNNRGD